MGRTSTTAAKADKRGPRAIPPVSRTHGSDTAGRAIYDGRERLGPNRQVGTNEFLTLDRLGRKLGLYDSAIEAANAIGKAAPWR